MCNGICQWHVYYIIMYTLTFSKRVNTFNAKTSWLFRKVQINMKGIETRRGN